MNICSLLSGGHFVYDRYVHVEHDVMKFLSLLPFSVNLGMNTGVSVMKHFFLLSSCGYFEDDSH